MHNLGIMQSQLSILVWFLQVVIVWGSTDLGCEVAMIANHSQLLAPGTDSVSLNKQCRIQTIIWIQNLIKSEYRYDLIWDN